MHRHDHDRAIGSRGSVGSKRPESGDLPAGRRGDALSGADLLILQRAAGNQAVVSMLTDQSVARTASGSSGARLPAAVGADPVLQRVPADPPSPSMAAAGPSLIQAEVRTFHEQMGRAKGCLDGIRFHFDFVNGMYAENMKIHKVVLGQAAAADQADAERMKWFLTAVELIPEVKILSIIKTMAEGAKALQGVAENVQAVQKFFSVPEYGPAGPVDPNVMRIGSLEKLTKLTDFVDTFRVDADAILDGAVDVALMVASQAPDQQGASAAQASAIAEALRVCQALNAATAELVSEIQKVEARRQFPVPSWHEVEQDIWIAYFAEQGHDGAMANSLIKKHLVDIELVGPGDEYGGRLGVASPFNAYGHEKYKYEPGREDEDAQQSVAPQMLTIMDIINREASGLSSKWSRLLLNRD